MKRNFILGIVVVSFVNLFSVVAQEETERSWVNDLSVGAALGMNGAINIIDYHVSSVKRTLGINVTAGALITYRFQPSNELTIGLNYYGLGFEDENQHVFIDGQRNLQKYLTTSGSFSYFTVSVMLRAYVMLIGFQLGIPLGGTVTNSLGGSTGLAAPYYDKDPRLAIGEKNVSSSDMYFQFEPKIGIEVPVIHKEKWGINLALLFGYPMQKISRSPAGYPSLNDNFRLPNVQIGTSFLYSLPDLIDSF